MALIKTGNIGGSARGGVDYELYCDQISGNGNERYVDICLRLRVAGNRDPAYHSSYGFPAQWKAYLNGGYHSGDIQIKGNEYWYSSQNWREFHHKTITNVGTTSAKTISVGFVLDSFGGDNQWDSGLITGQFTVGATNSAPSMWGTITTKYRINGGNWTTITSEAGLQENVLKIPESADCIRVEWIRGSDDKGEDNLTYHLYNQSNESAWSVLYSGRINCYEHYIGSGNEGRSYDYYVKATDSNGASSVNIDTTQFQKNSFTESVIQNISDIRHGSQEVSIEWTNPSNTLASANDTFSFEIISDKITVYNATAVNDARNIKIKIVDSATTGPYILKKDIIKSLPSNAIGTLNFSLTTTNKFGTRRTSTRSCNVNLQSPPVPASNISFSLNSKSTAYKKLASNNTYYFIPNDNDTIHIYWTAGSDNLGGPVTYDVYVSYNDSPWNWLVSGLISTEYTHIMRKQNAATTIKYLIETRTGYGHLSTSESPTQNIHVYNETTLVTNNIVRTSTSATISYSIKSVNSFDGIIKTIGKWECRLKDSDTLISSGQLANTQGDQSITVNGLKADDQYSLKVIYNDNSGLGKEKESITAIGGVSPIFFVNRYGVGVNGVKADSSYSFNVKGNSNVSGTLRASGVQVNGQSVYHTGNKPTKSDVGLSNIANYSTTTDINSTASNLYATASMVSKVREEKVNKVNALVSNTLTFNLEGTNKAGMIGVSASDVYIYNNKSDKYLQFQDNGTLTISNQIIGDIRYPIVDRVADRWWGRIAPVMSDGVIEIGKYIDFHETNNGSADYQPRLIAQGGNVVCTGGFVNGSDRRLKEHIMYLDDFNSTELDKRNAFKDFIKNDLRIAQYKYLKADKLNLGFIAQDVYEHPVGKLFTGHYGEDDMLLYDNACFTAVIARALQEEIREKDEKIKELNNRLNILEDTVKGIK